MPKVPKPYSLDETTSFTYKQLKKLPYDDLIIVMRNWFLEHYEDPVHECPYDEGDYVFIHGGPYDAHDILASEFYEDKFEKAVTEVADELTSECPCWSGKDDGSDYLAYQYEIIDYVDSENAFYESLEIIKNLLKIKISHKLYQNYVNLLYANVITTLETYLFDTFVKLATGNGQYTDKYILIKKEKNLKGKKLNHQN